MPRDPRDGSVGLRRFGSIVEKGLNLSEAVCDEGAQLSVMRRHLEGRVDQKTAPSFSVIHRTLDDLFDEATNGLFWRQRVFKPLDQRPRRCSPGWCSSACTNNARLSP